MELRLNLLKGYITPGIKELYVLLNNKLNPSLSVIKYLERG
jgi:hypothetical protein